MKKRHVFVGLVLLFLFLGLGGSAAPTSVGAQDASQCDASYLQTYQALLDQRQAALDDGNVIMAIHLLQEAENVLTPCLDPTLSDGLLPAGSPPDWTPIEQTVDNIAMVQVPSGCFTMGSANGESDEQPEHEICFSLPYWIDKLEVTRAMYNDCVAAGSCTPTLDSTLSTRDTQPINRVTWFQAETYCEWRGMALPTESEWEYAARGPANLMYPWGNSFVADNVVYGMNSNDELADVGSRPAGQSWVGALDMSGNASEWVRTIYQDYPYTFILGTNDQDRVVRGGSYSFSLSNRLRAAIRQRYAPTFELDAIGFRCVDSNIVDPAPNDTCEVSYEKAQILLDQEYSTLQQSTVSYKLLLISQARALIEPCIGNDTWEPVVEQFNQIDMVEVPPGCFEMGRNDGESDEQPATKICFDEVFWLDKTEVTRDMYARCVAAGVCTPIPTTEDSQRSTQPQNYATWLAANTYCAWRGARLPTEAEWEYAARGPDNWLYPWGEGFGVRQAVYDNRDKGTDDVGSIPSGASWVGALDMSGNVGEWVSSIYQSYPYSANDGRENAEDTTSPRVWRGGSFFDYDSDKLMTVTRQKNDPSFANQNHGFRCALSDTE